jgi:Kef-type K+ transport system membrane component KefB/CBS domain-containing protein
LAARAGLPRVTVYILVGFALGPHALLRLVEPGGLSASLLLSSGTEAPLDVISQLAIGFILFGIGGAFRFQTLRRVGPRVLLISGAEIITTAILVGLAVLAGTQDWRLAIIAPALAISSAPSATLVTLREVEAEGPASRSIILCVGQNNLVALFIFPILLSLAFGSGTALSATGFSITALGIGVGLGLVAAIAVEAIHDRRDLVILGLLTVLAALGFSNWVESGSAGLAMLACFAAGLTIANASSHWESLFRYVENTVYPLYVLFFVAAGRDLHVEAFATLGFVGFAFILARATGKFFGALIGVRLAGWRNTLPSTLGAGLMCQAGVALGFVAALESAAPEATAGLRNIVVASVVVFELLGPWLVRRTAVRAGEVKLASLLPHTEASGTDAFRWVFLEIRRNLGLLKRSKKHGDVPLTTQHAMRRRPEVIYASDSFERVMKCLGESGADLLPVIDSEGHLRGVISYEEVKNALYDPLLRGVVIAQDLTIPISQPLGPNDPLSEALERMDRNSVQSWPVVEGSALLGMVRRSDVYGLMRRDFSRSS